MTLTMMMMSTPVNGIQLFLMLEETFRRYKRSKYEDRIVIERRMKISIFRLATMFSFVVIEIR